RSYKDGRIPRRDSKSFWKFVLDTCNDKALMLLTITVLTSLVIALYQKFTGQHQVGDTSARWTESMAIIAAVAVVIVTGSFTDWQMERHFIRRMAYRVLHLKPGDVTDVDGLLLRGTGVQCDEFAATHEAGFFPKDSAEKVSADVKEGKVVIEADSFIHSGSRVMNGEGTLLVTGTGHLQVTLLQSKLNEIAERIARLVGVTSFVLLVTLLVTFCTKLPQNTGAALSKAQEVLDILIAVIIFIIVGVPQGLPLAPTMALAFAIPGMRGTNNFVRYLKGCDVLGNATTICSGVAGIVSRSKSIVVAGTVGNGFRFERSRTAASEKSAQEFTPQQIASELAKDTQDLLLKSISLNSTAFEGDVDGVSTFIGSKVETALLMFAREFLALDSVSEERVNGKILQLIPFDYGRKCMGVVAQLENGKARLYVKGASEILLSKCTRLLKSPDQDSSSGRLRASDIESIDALIKGYTSRSLTVIGLGYRDFDIWPLPEARRSEDNSSDAVLEEVFTEMCFIGLVAIQEPLIAGVPEAARDCQRAGVFLRLVTSHEKLTACAIAKECGILHDEGIAMEGPEFLKLDKEEQNKIIPSLQVLASSSSKEKQILVERLKDLGETVAVIGEDTKDASVLNVADIGFSIEGPGAGIAKEGSGIHSVASNFPSIVEALKWGRAVSYAVKRFLQFQLTVTITIGVLVFFTAVVSAHQKPLFTAVQLLWINLVKDTLAALALVTDPPQNSILDRAPDRRGSRIVSSAMWKMIIGQTIYQLGVTFSLRYTATRLAVVEEQEYIHALVFNTFVWMQIFNLWNNRRLDNNLNVFEGLTRHWLFFGINAILCGGQVLIVFFGGTPFSIPTTTSEGRLPQSGLQWGIAIGFGLASIPVGAMIRCFRNRFVWSCIRGIFERRDNSVHHSIALDEEKSNRNNTHFGDVSNDLRFIKFNGGRLKNLE
ncbi:uncharacterized protein B0I36DRAFT_229382, partial [Microdochium trichocladiopsis]